MEIGIIILFNLIIFYRTLFYSIIVDDIRQYQSIKKGVANHTQFSNLTWNILDTLKKIKYDLKIRLYGGATFGNNRVIDHTLAILIHTCICVLIYMVFGYSKVSLMAALLYACHPSNHQTSIWLNGRRYAIAILLLLLAMLYKPWGLFLYPLTFFFQITTLFAPIIFLKEYPILMLLIPIMIGANWSWIKKKIKHRMKMILCEEQKKWSISRIPIIVKSYGFYFFRMFTPWTTLMNYPDLYWWGIVKDKSDECYKINLEFWRGALAIAISGVGLYYFNGIERLFWAFMILSTLQWSAILSAVQLNTDRYISLPNVFAMYFLAKILTLAPYGTTIFFCYLVYFNYNLSMVMRMYWGIDAYHRYQMYFQPQLTKPRFNRIEFYLRSNRMLTAWYLVEEGLQYNPNDFHFLLHSAICNVTIGNIPKAMEALEAAKQNYYMGQEEMQSKSILGMEKMIAQAQKNTHSHNREKERRRKQMEGK